MKKKSEISGGERLFKLNLIIFKANIAGKKIMQQPPENSIGKNTDELQLAVQSLDKESEKQPPIRKLQLKLKTADG